MNAETVFTTIADHLEEKTAEIGLFLASGGDFEPWCVWEAFAACRNAGWTAVPRPSYSTSGLLGSREAADLLVGIEGGAQVLVELGLVHCWSTNRWVAEVDRDTRALSRRFPATTSPLQLVLAVASEPIERNELWRSWLEMTAIWPRPTDLERRLALDGGGQGLLRGWRLEA